MFMKDPANSDTELIAGILLFQAPPVNCENPHPAPLSLMWEEGGCRPGEGLPCWLRLQKWFPDLPMRYAREKLSLQFPIHKRLIATGGAVLVERFL
jgi:hypothetical protein